MRELTAGRARDIKIKKMPLTKDGFEIATKKIEHEHVAQKLQRSAVQKHGGNELPGIGVTNSAIAQGKKFADKSRFPTFQKKLANESGRIGADQCQKNDSLPFSPRA